MTAKKKRAVSIICLVLAFIMLVGVVITTLSSAFAVSQSQIDSLKDQQNSISSQKDALKDKMNGIKGDVSSYMAKKQALDEQNNLARQEIELINEQIDLYVKLVEQKAVELEEAKRVEKEQAEELRVRMRAMEENGSLSYLSILFKATSFTDFLSKLADVNAMMESDKSLEEAYIAARENVEKVKAEYEATLEEQKETKTELEKKQAELQKQITAAEQVITQLEADLANYEAEFNANAAQEKAISDQIAKLEEELKNQNASNGNTGNTGSGVYMWPVNGTSKSNVTSPYGYRKHPIFGDQRFHSGVDISASSGTTIVAADAGTVLTAVYSSSYGNYVVISHGNGSSTLYAHMSSMAVTAGQAVTKGQTIGYVGSTGWSTGPHCHFEIRVNNALVDPVSYF